MNEDIVLTPMMKQFLDLKAKHPDAVMLFRCGDFYETYSTDAIVASRDIGHYFDEACQWQRENNRNGGISSPCTGYAICPNWYVPGKRVAICDQLEDPKLTKEIGETRYHRIGNSGCFHQ